MELLRVIYSAEFRKHNILLAEPLCEMEKNFPGSTAFLLQLVKANDLKTPAKKKMKKNEFPSDPFNDIVVAIRSIVDEHVQQLYQVAMVHHNRAEDVIIDDKAFAIPRDASKYISSPFPIKLFTILTRFLSSNTFPRI